MKTVNLRWIYHHYQHDELVEVSVAIRRGLRNMRRCYDGLFPAE